MKKSLSLKDLRFIPFITHEYSGTIKEMKRGKQKNTSLKTVWPMAQKNMRFTYIYTYKPSL